MFRLIRQCMATTWNVCFILQKFFSSRDHPTMLHSHSLQCVCVLEETQLFWYIIGKADLIGISRNCIFNLRLDWSFMSIHTNTRSCNRYNAIIKLMQCTIIIAYSAITKKCWRCARANACMLARFMSNQDASKSYSFSSAIRFHHLAGGLCGGVVATLITHPFDLIKLRLAGKIFLVCVCVCLMIIVESPHLQSIVVRY